MVAIPLELTLLCHAATRAMKTGCFPTGDESVEADERAALVARFDDAQSKVISSHALAARETASWMTETYETDHAFDDLNYGAWRGLSVREIGKQKPEEIAAWLSNPHARPHGGESIAMLAKRVVEGLERLPHAEGVIIVTHAIVVKVVSAHVHRKPLSDVLTMDFAPLSTTVLNYHAELRASS
jgi:broad specificity phosphatase PhoE